MMPWIKAAIGEYWESGNYVISTYREIPSGNSGYRLTHQRTPIGDYNTLQDAQDGAMDDALERV